MVFWQNSGGTHAKAVKEKHLLSLLPFVPKLVALVESEWKSRLLQVWISLEDFQNLKDSYFASLIMFSYASSFLCS